MTDIIINSHPFPSPNPHVSLQIITYRSQGLKVKGLLAEPKKPGQYDGLLYLRGGIKNVGMVRPSRIAQFASEGFIVFAPFYRGNQGGEGEEDFALEDRNDAFSAYELLEHHPRVKNKRIHIFGFSRGGVMALWTAIQFPEATSLVTWGGVADLVLTYEERVDLRRMLKRVIGGTPKKNPLGYQMRTPLDYVDKIHAPLLIIHGEKDENVSIEHAYRLEKRVKECGKEVECWYFTDYTHYFPPKANREVVHQLANWMKKQ